MEDYNEIVAYKTQLYSAIKKIQYFDIEDIKGSKKIQAFQTSCNELLDTLNNIIELDNVINNFKKFETLDADGLKNNKSAAKFKDKKSSFYTELLSNRKEMEDKFYKQMEIYSKQNKYICDAENVFSKGFSASDRKKYWEMSNDLRHMLNEDKVNIPIERKEPESFTNATSHDSHLNEADKIEENTKFKMEQLDRLEESYNGLKLAIEEHPSKELLGDVKKEVAEIKKALPPKVISASKDVINKLKNSQNLSIDLEQINDVMHTTRSFSGEDGKLQKLNQKYEELSALLSAAIEEERKNTNSLADDSKINQTKVEYATKAVDTYSAKLHSVQVEGKTGELPIEYTQMKKKLSQMSSLENLEMNNVQVLDEGGLSR